MPDKAANLILTNGYAKAEVEHHLSATQLKRFTAYEIFTPALEFFRCNCSVWRGSWQKMTDLFSAEQSQGKRIFYSRKRKSASVTTSKNPSSA
jgi:hypothetical protein